jgi:hypothetical protein
LRTVASFLDDAHAPTRKISDQLGEAPVGMTQDRYLGRRLTHRETAEALERIIDEPGASGVPDVSRTPGDPDMPGPSALGDVRRQGLEPRTR